MPQLPYKFFGKAGSRTQGGTNGTISEYNPISASFQPRVNDLYIFCPPFGKDVANAVIWTPSFRRVQSDNQFPKSPYLEFSIEEVLTPANYLTNGNINRVTYSTLETNGITMYIKMADETLLDDFSQVRETIITPRAVKSLTGVCASNGNILSTGQGNTFGLTLGWAFCLGLRMDKSVDFTTYRGRYYYYIVNRNPDNNQEIFWRLCFIVGGTTFGATNPTTIAGTTLPFGTYVVTNADPSEPTNTISIPVNGTDTTFILQGSAGDSTIYGPGITLQIDYSLLKSLDLNDNGTDSTVAPTDFRPYIINSVPVV